MRSYHARILTATLALVLAVAIVLFWISKAPAQNYDRRAIVKLYSGGQLVATWDATSIGHMDGNTLLFAIGTAPSSTQVRISGTFSVENVPQ